MTDPVTIHHLAAGLTALVAASAVPTWEALGWTTEPATPKAPAKPGKTTAAAAEKE
jgi:hypothetical protein